MSEGKFWLIFWAIVFGNFTACSVLTPRPIDSSVACIKAGGQWTGVFGSCQRLPTTPNPNRSE